jgi:hypothetical protein
MALYDFTTTADAALLTHVKPPVLPVEHAVVSNVAISQTVGGKVTSQIRGADRRRWVLTWRRVTATHLGYFTTWWASYGASKAAFKVQITAGGTTVRVRCPQGSLEVREVADGRWDVVVELIEDLV